VLPASALTTIADAADTTATTMPGSNSTNTNLTDTTAHISTTSTSTTSTPIVSPPPTKKYVIGQRKPADKVFYFLNSLATLRCLFIFVSFRVFYTYTYAHIHT
jgi:hypothetical protein